MDSESTSSPEIGCGQFALLRQLVDSLLRAHAAVVHSDLMEMMRQTTYQKELCARLRLLAQSPVTGKNDANLEELKKLHEEAAALNRKYGVLLRRARRTVDIFCRVLATSLTYPPPRNAAILAPAVGSGDR
jgi:hypothetical protein